MVRCTKCRFLFEPCTIGLLPACAQCGGVTMAVLKIEPSDAPPAQPTMKFWAAKDKPTAASG
jgi:predicted  nucleic acid-binding Zn-ribbon protein